MKGESAAVFGLGNVGLVNAILLAEMGLTVVGVEINEEKIKLLKSDQIYIKEKNLESKYEKIKNNIYFTNNFNEAKKSNILIVCVGTPPKPNGSVDLTQIKETMVELAKIIASSKDQKTIVIRSTVPPETTRKVLIPLIEKHSDKKHSTDFTVYYHPEFLREGEAVDDFLNPHMHVLGLEKIQNVSLDNFSFLNNCEKFMVSTYEEAEMIKYVNNSFHALKTSFANECGVIAGKYGVNIDELFKIFTSETKLNVSEKYLRPGFSFGGPCLKKEVLALEHLARQKEIETPLISSIIISNDDHTKRYLENIDQPIYKKILFVGVTFKQDTNDTRESPILILIRELKNKPTYQKKQIHVLDSKQAVDSLINTVDRSFDDIDSIDDIYDLVVLGPRFEPDVFQKFLGSKFINLGFHEYDKEVIEKGIF